MKESEKSQDRKARQHHATEDFERPFKQLQGLEQETGNTTPAAGCRWRRGSAILSSGM